jgi:hypothetical protein
MAIIHSYLQNVYCAFLSEIFKLWSGGSKGAGNSDFIDIFKIFFSDLIVTETTKQQMPHHR